MEARGEAPTSTKPTKSLRKRFDEELTELLLKFKWWEKSINEINSLIPILTDSDLEKIKERINIYLSVAR